MQTRFFLLTMAVVVAACDQAEPRPCEALAECLLDGPRAGSAESCVESFGGDLPNREAVLAAALELDDPACGLVFDDEEPRDGSEPAEPPSDQGNPFAGELRNAVWYNCPDALARVLEATLACEAGRPSEIVPEKQRP